LLLDFFINEYVSLTGLVPVRETRRSKRMMGNLQTSRFSNLPDPKSQNPVGKSSGTTASGNKKQQPQKSTADKRSKFVIVVKISLSLFLKKKSMC
jgi:hypothetical protein